MSSQFENCSYFLPLFDRPKINIIFSNALKVRSCIANQIHNSKTILYSEKETKQIFCLECCFCFRFSTLLLISYMIVQIQSSHKQQIFLDSSCLSCHTVCQSYQPEKIRNPVQKRCFHIHNVSQHFTEVYPNTPLYLLCCIFLNLRGLSNLNSLWE